MIINHRLVTLTPPVALALMLAGCASTHSASYTKFANAFLPAAPSALSTPSSDPAPAALPAPSGLYAHEPVDLLAAVAPLPSLTDLRLRQADEHYRRGRDFYDAGDPTNARAEFDRAIEALLTTPADPADRQRLERKTDQLTEAIYRLDTEGLGASQSAGEIVYDKPPLEGILDMTFPVDPSLKPKVAGELGGTASQLPLELRDPVLSFIHYFSTDRGHKILEAGLRRAGRYRGMIEQTLAQEGIPKELIYLAQDESGFLPRARSYKSCVGLWQFAQFRGREYGLNQTPYYDERMDPVKATQAAAHHLHDLYKHFGDWYLAMAAYDCGPGCVDHAVERTGYADFWELQRLNVLPKETSNYVPLILAMTIMAKNPKDYGLDGVVPDPAESFDTVPMQGATSLPLVADALGVTVAELQDLNPALIRNVAPDGYALKVPKGRADDLTSALAQVPVEHRAAWRLHRVEPGETFASIAHRTGSSVRALQAANSGIELDPAPGALIAVPLAPRPERVTRRVVASRSHTTHRSRHTAATARRRATSHTHSSYTASLHSPHRRSTTVNR